MSARASSEGEERGWWWWWGEERRCKSEEEEEGGLVDEEVWALVPQVTWSCCNPQRRPLKAANVPRCQAAGCCTISYSSSSLPSSSSHLGLHSRPMLRLLAPEKFFTAKSQRVSRETVCTTQIWGLLICLIAHVG